MNTNHFDHRVVYRSKLVRLKSNIKQLEEAAKILDQLPEKMVQAVWRKIAEKEILGKNDEIEGVQKSKSSKGPFKLSLKKTIQNFKKHQSDMHNEIQEKFRNIDSKTLKLEQSLMERLQNLVEKYRNTSSQGSYMQL